MSCSTVIVNDVKSSPNTIPVDLKGNHLVSPWKFVIHGNYELFNEGRNTITVKLYCSYPETISSNSVMITAVRPAQIDSVGPITTNINTTTITNTNTNTTSTSTTTTASDRGHDYNGGYKGNGFDIVAAGDYGCNAVTEETVNKMKERNPDLFLALGDLSEDILLTTVKG